MKIEDIRVGSILVLKKNNFYEHKSFPIKFLILREEEIVLSKKEDNFIIYFDLNKNNINRIRKHWVRDLYEKL